MNRIFYSFTTVSVVTSLLVATTLDKNDALTYLNSLRVSAGILPLKNNQILETAAQNHINYLNDRSLSGHYENNLTDPSDFYTGDIPHDRGVFAGYKASFYLENFSSGQDDFNSSIDGLMSAIYHRYGFLHLNIDEIGIGVSDTDNKLFNYDMGNSLVNKLCDGDSYSGDKEYYYNVCTNNDLKIEVNLYEDSLNSLAKESSDIIVWPPSNSENISPVFYEESPDPLPDSSVSGYPISLEFNSYIYKNNTIFVKNFELYDEKDNLVQNMFLMNETNDINAKHTPYQFTLFPLNRLEWNSIYKVVVDYSIDDRLYKKEWEFKTKKLPYPLYNVDTNEKKIIVASDKTYAIYFRPVDGEDIFNSITFYYNTESKPNVTMYDSNTLLVKLVGEDEMYCNIELKKDNIVVKNLDLTIGKNSLEVDEDKFFQSEVISYTTSAGTTFETDIENSTYQDFTLRTATVKDKNDHEIAVVLDEKDKEYVDITFNIDNREYQLPSFDIKSYLNVQNIENEVIITVKTKLKKSITFEEINNVY